MTIRSKLSVAFSIAATFLLAVGIVAIVLIGQLNPLLEEIGRAHLRLNQVADVISALRLHPEQTPQNLARVGDLESSTRTDAERNLARAAREDVTRDPTLSGTIDKLQQLADGYRQDAIAALNQLVVIHRRAVFWTTVFITEGVLLLCIIMFLVRAWLLKPMLALRDASHRIAGGDWQQRANAPPTGEFAELANSINQIAASRNELAERAAKSERFAAVGEACSHVAHNMRSLLAAIHSLAHYQRGAPNITPDVKETFNQILATTDTLERWVRDVMNSVRPFEPKPVRQQLEPVIHDSLALLTPRISEKAIAVEWKSQDDLPAVHLDRPLFEQALVAIVSNAIDASPRKGRIIVAAENGENGMVIVCIEDEGAGMSAEIHRRAFDHFFTTKPQAAGLGLTIAHKIVALHGGKIEIDSQPDQGTRVRIHLPASAKR